MPEAISSTGELIAPPDSTISRRAFRALHLAVALDLDADRTLALEQNAPHMGARHELRFLRPRFGLR